MKEVSREEKQLLGLTEKEFNAIFEGVSFCFCLQCSHHKEHGFCESCHCHNGSTSPQVK